ncbi:sulfite exporter TauE/SafE family protein [Shewanella sp. A3A]|nr:sulfite exporter TauE/SafE family protein [Shewanella ferrihydritica]
MLQLIDPPILLLASLVIFVGAITQSLIGFGLAVVSAPLLYIIDPELVPVPVILMGFSISLLTLMRERGHLEFNGLQWGLLGRIPGGLIGAALLLIAPQAVLGLIIAAIVAIALWLSIKRYQAPVNRFSITVAGIFSGIFGTIAGIGGPPMALLLTGRDAGKFRAALSAFFALSSLISLVILFAVGKLQLHHLLLAALLLPAVFIGFWLSNFIVPYVDRRRTRQFTLCLCAINVLVLVIKSVYSW